MEKITKGIKPTSVDFTLAERREKKNPIGTALEIIKQFEPKGALLAYEERLDGELFSSRNFNPSTSQERANREGYYNSHLAAYRKHVQSYYKLPDLVGILQKHIDWKAGKPGGECYPGAFLLAVAETYRDKSKQQGPK